jgi:hypothetical protein
MRTTIPITAADNKRENAMRNQKFVIMPHFRLHEWIAEEKGYFRDEGLDYEFQETIQSTDGKAHSQGDKVGAMQTIEKGRTSDISCACHWTINVAAAKGHGKLYGDAYSVSPCGVFVPQDSKIKTPEDLAGVPISVGYQSGSHYATIQALEQYMPLDQINLSFKEGMLFSRMDLLFEGKIPACTLFSGPYYFAEQLGFRKVTDCTFMMASMITGEPDPEDVRKFFRALNVILICGPSSTRGSTRTSSPSAITTRWIRGAGDPASASCSSRIRARCSRSRATGSASGGFSRGMISAGRPMTRRW